MNLTHSSTQSAIDAALGHIGQAAATSIDATAKRLDNLVTSPEAASAAGREAIFAAHKDLQTQLPTFQRVFNEGLRNKVMQEFAPRHERRREAENKRTNWESLSLVEDGAVEERLYSDRIGQGISHACEWELRELATYTGALLPAEQVDKDPNPFRPEVLGAALYSAIEAVAPERESRMLLARELGPVVANNMRLCYSEIVRDLKSRGVQPLHLAMRGVDAASRERAPTVNSLLARDSQPVKSGFFRTSGRGQLDVANSGSGNLTHGGGPAPRRSGPARGSLRGNRAPGTAWVRRPYGDGGHDNAPRYGGQSSVADAEMMSLIRRLTSASDPASDSADGAMGRLANFSAPANEFGDGGADVALNAGDLRGDGLTGQVAVNLIRAHREELRQASSGTIEHMVIDVVASLFDQILSDSRVLPQMAGQIARLQLPVLRVALSDSSFFSSRKHPVRRFVNRLASLACAFDDFEAGPGLQFLARVRELVQEIVDGDFDQVDVYAEKLNALGLFVEQQTKTEVQSTGTAALLDGKESDLLVQQRYMQQLRAALAPMALPGYLHDFLAEVWSQALTLVARRDGPTAERTLRLRRAACDLVMSIQPKGTPALRKEFLTRLPQLTKDLSEGLKLIGWSAAAQREFFDRLMPAHAESLNGKGRSELERNLMARQLEVVFNVPPPSAGQFAGAKVAAEVDAAAFETQFSAEEARKIGLVSEASVNWDRRVDIDLGAGGKEQAEGADLNVRQEQLDLGQGLDLNANPAEPTEPSHGPQLMDHVQVGLAYKMLLKDNWQKVRLSYVSKGRGFFVFTHGKTHQETISLTSRMLKRMCETGRLRAYESSQLLERATARARKQLAAIKAGRSVH